MVRILYALALYSRLILVLLFLLAFFGLLLPMYCSEGESAGRCLSGARILAGIIPQKTLHIMGGADFSLLMCYLGLGIGLFLRNDENRINWIIPTAGSLVLALLGLDGFKADHLQMDPAWGYSVLLVVCILSGALRLWYTFWGYERLLVWRASPEPPPVADQEKENEAEITDEDKVF